MKKNVMKAGLGLALMFGCAISPSSSVAQPATAEPYPVRPIRLIVPSGPGSATDLAARIFADEASRRLGHQVVADNRTGAGGRIGPETAARAPADGYTLIWANSVGFGVLSTTAKTLAYDPVKDFTPIAPVASFEIAMVCNPRLVPARTLQELIAYMKAKPDQVRVASAGVGAGNHFALELFNWRAGVRTVHVPYRSPVQGIQDVVAGSLECTMDSQVVAQVEAGELRAYAVSGTQRDPRLPDIPTMAEAGLQNYDLTWFQAIAAPAGTPPAIVAKLEATAREIATDPAFQERMGRAGLTPLSGGSDDLARMIQFEINRYQTIAKQADLHFE